MSPSPFSCHLHGVQKCSSWTLRAIALELIWFLWFVFPFILINLERMRIFCGNMQVCLRWEIASELIHMFVALCFCSRFAVGMARETYDLTYQGQLQVMWWWESWSSHLVLVATLLLIIGLLVNIASITLLFAYFEVCLQF